MVTNNGRISEWRFVLAAALITVTLHCFNSISSAQTHPKFNVSLLFDYSAAEQCVALLDGELVNIDALTELRGNRIAASTTGLIADRDVIAAQLRSYLDSIKYHQVVKDDIYHLEKARDNVTGIKQLLDEMKKRNFNRRVIATVEQIFPSDAEIDVTIPVYVVTLGHENVDAFVRRIVWHGDTPQFVGENEGELTIVINLSHAVDYGLDLEERFVSLLGVVAHEVFHAAFGAYKATSSSWNRYSGKHQTPFDELLDLTQNEGIAYYLSLDQRGQGYLPRDWFNRTREVFSTFNKNASELLSPTLTPRRAGELIRTANLSGYWESYGAMTGMFIAREIDLRMGRAALIESIARDPADFFQKYINLIGQDSNLPKLSDSIVRQISSK
ncbi:MAG: hypothetical protein HYR76_02940 [Ignavibacteria bacterium]|nr:hypothetical protein [Ignavibacteria bacterium]MBI3766631.1 hypothetical protein [Ignavibacteriales bacterium]